MLGLNRFGSFGVNRIYLSDILLTFAERTFGERVMCLRKMVRSLATYSTFRLYLRISSSSSLVVGEQLSVPVTIIVEFF